MSDQPQETIEVTPERAAAIVAAVKAGQPIPGMTIKAQSAPATAPQPEPEPEAFEVVNPPLAVYRPGGIGTERSIRGYMLALQIDAISSAAFYVLQLTEQCNCLVGAEGIAELGDHVVVYDAPTLRALRSMLPTWQSVAGSTTCTSAYEVIIEPWRRNPDFIVQARRIVRPNVSKPGFACVPLLGPLGEVVMADGEIKKTPKKKRAPETTETS